MTGTPALLAADARNRALRTLLQGLALDVLVAVALLVADALEDGAPDWRLLGLSVVRTVLQTAASYVMRRVVDGSALPTPLPPDPPGEPDAPTVGDAGHADGAYLVVMAAVALIVVVLYDLASRLA